MVRDSVEGPRFGWIWANGVFSPSGQYLAYWAADKEDGARFLVVNGRKVGKTYDKFLSSEDKNPLLSFSPTTRASARWPGNNDEWKAILDGQERNGYDKIAPTTRASASRGWDIYLLRLARQLLYWCRRATEMTTRSQTADAAPQSAGK